MKTLSDYISNAIHYVLPDESPGGSKRQRKRFMKLVKKYDLDREFLKLVEENPEWEKLANSNQVFFFEEIPNSRFGIPVMPSIRLLCAERGSVPVIEIVIPEK